MYWKHKLNKKQLKHCRDNGLYNKEHIMQAIIHQNHIAMPCWTCIQIAKIAGLKIPMLGVYWNTTTLKD